MWDWEQLIGDSFPWNGDDERTDRRLVPFVFHSFLRLNEEWETNIHYTIGLILMHFLPHPLLPSGSPAPSLSKVGKCFHFLKKENRRGKSVKKYLQFNATENRLRNKNLSDFQFIFFFPVLVLFRLKVIYTTNRIFSLLKCGLISLTSHCIFTVAIGGCILSIEARRPPSVYLKHYLIILDFCCLSHFFRLWPTWAFLFPELLLRHSYLHFE